MFSVDKRSSLFCLFVSYDKKSFLTSAPSPELPLHSLGVGLIGFLHVLPENIFAMKLVPQYSARRHSA